MNDNERIREIKHSVSYGCFSWRDTVWLLDRVENLEKALKYYAKGYLGTATAKRALSPKKEEGK